jgi:hypothetical protein
MKVKRDCRGIMFGNFDHDKERYTLTSGLKEAMLEAIIDYCRDVDEEPDLITELYIKERLYDLNNYSDHVAEELYLAFRRNANRVKSIPW